ncbi:L-glutamate gamma-semialdehyde dehydrogenase [Acidithiobacillus sp. AMEEHan]|uniref:L-glutamate gamma-semialdehyde dehydrogenase n=1 Tax=Acidithiobacillus sp. AMEEHan TaxID=2994951 RepID=UPI0027E3EA55|nr:L-glutamate gamma-semialdehyde dehydrogenase [Acidithiobacillus sp. AMEEHan]
MLDTSNDRIAHGGELDCQSAVQKITLPAAVRSEPTCVMAAEHCVGELSWDAVVERAAPWVQGAREAQRHNFLGMEALLAEYPLDSASGLSLMRLSEALLRVPDRATASVLAADQLRRGFSEPDWRQENTRSLITPMLRMAAQWLPDPKSTTPRQTLGARSVLHAATQAVRFMGHQFILGETIEQAQKRAASQHRLSSNWRFSFDMLGESARCLEDAERYYEAYQRVLTQLRRQEQKGGPVERDGLSIKLSALEPRLEAVQLDILLPRLLPKLVRLTKMAAEARVGLTIDAEESERLELTLQILAALLAAIADDADCAGWAGLGIAIQAYQTRALEAVDVAIVLAQEFQRPLMLRLVKGAYWDSEVKRAQELGLPGYPVYTRKRHTDVSYLACARKMLAAASAGHIFAQFATHNATTISAILLMAEGLPQSAFELQKLHGMGDAVYAEVLAAESVPVRVYAPVGTHRDLLAYLVRRLLENGANSSFVHQLAQKRVPLSALLANPFFGDNDSPLPLPAEIYGEIAGVQRRNPCGVDGSEGNQRSALLQAWRDLTPRKSRTEDPCDVIPERMRKLQEAQQRWNSLPLAERCACLLRAADLLETERNAFAALVVWEGHKSWIDAVAEVRETIDYCRYYGLLAQEQLAERSLPGPTGESNVLRMEGRGSMVCISPWNFPLAIFAGQLLAAIVCGNTVAVKPAEQTPAVAEAFVSLLQRAGVPADVVDLFHGPGPSLGAGLVRAAGVAGVLFTGSTGVAKQIQRSLAMSDGPIVPLLAETGGINAMIVDSTALPEQVVDHVLLSTFRSAGQRCSALRLLFVQDDIADGLLHMLAGAMALLRIGEPEDFASDVGPVIDINAQKRIVAQTQRLESQGGKLLARSPWPSSASISDDGIAAVMRDSLGRALHFIAPSLYVVTPEQILVEEIFGPVLQVVRWSGSWEDVVQQINAFGYGLTLGIQTRIDSRAERISRLARIGNIYINRGMTGAVVGVQPFGGEGLSGTGPKAGGPHFLSRLCQEKSISINTAAAGGMRVCSASQGGDKTGYFDWFPVLRSRAAVPL